MTTGTDGEARSTFLVELDRVTVRVDEAWQRQQAVEAVEPFDRTAAEAATADPSQP